MAETQCPSVHLALGNLGILGQLKRIGWGGRREGGQAGGDTCIPMADWCWCMAKTTTIL